MLLNADKMRRPGAGGPLMLCDLTQSYAPTGGGGISTYLREKRDYVLTHTPHHLLQIVPGPVDKITVNGRHVFVQVGARQVPGSPNYRFILRTNVVREVLATYRPDVIESLCPWVLPWTAIHHRRQFPETTLVAGYRTDFPNAHIYRVGEAKFGTTVARALRHLSYAYARRTYREFDWVYTLSEDARAALGRLAITHTDVLPLGVDIDMFSPAKRDPAFRRELGLGGDGPLLIYSGRVDNEKRADRLVTMFKRLPTDLGAAMVMVGDGKLMDKVRRMSSGLPVAFLGFEQDRGQLARALASSDIYVSAMADETFGVSVIEAQACGLPVVGVASGAMPDRVPAGLGLLGPVDDTRAMAANVQRLWAEDHDAVGAAARAHVETNFSWRRTFERLLGDIYPKAMRESAERLAGARVRQTQGAYDPALMPAE